MLKKCLMLSLLALSIPAVRAQSVAYVANNINGTVDVVNTGTDTVVATISGFFHPFCVAVSPDGKLLYVCNTNNTISAVNTETKAIIATISLGAIGFVGIEGSGPVAAFSPDGKLAYVANSGGGVNSSLIVINTQSNTVVSTTTFGSTFLLAVAASPGNIYLASTNGVIVMNATTLATITTIDPGHYIFDLALSPNGKTLNASDNTGLLGGASGVLVIDTGTNTVTATVPLSSSAFASGIGVTPDGLHVYVEDFVFGHSTVTVINTADNSVSATIPGNGLTLIGLAITSDGSTVLAVNGIISTSVDSSVVVIPTATNTITNSITVGLFADAITTNLTVPFSSFSAKLDTSASGFDLKADFTLGAGGQAINPPTQALTLQVGTYQVTIPAGSFHTAPHGTFVFEGTINGVTLQAHISPTGSNSYEIQVEGSGVNLSGLPQPVTVGLGIANNAGTVQVNGGSN